MERHEAVALLKELIANNLAVPSLVALKENGDCKFSLVIKGDCDGTKLRSFIADKGLILTEDTTTGHYTFDKP